jgi:hypothetical protein
MECARMAVSADSDVKSLFLKVGGGFGCIGAAQPSGGIVAATGLPSAPDTATIATFVKGVVRFVGPRVR